MTSIVFQVLGGLGLFLFGMKIMSEGLQKFAGKRLRHILKMVSNNRFIGCAVGTFVTSVIQSSSATVGITMVLACQGRDYQNEARKFLSLVVNAMNPEDKEIMQKSWGNRNEIDTMVDKMKEAHLLRLQKGICTVEAGVIFVEILTAFEKMGGFCFNISEAVAGLK